MTNSFPNLWRAFIFGKWKHEPMHDSDIIAEEIWYFGYSAVFLNDIEYILSKGPWSYKE